MRPDNPKPSTKQINTATKIGFSSTASTSSMEAKLHARYLAKIYTWEKAWFYAVTGGSMQASRPLDGATVRVAN
jgi:hypothetical protein